MTSSLSSCLIYVDIFAQAYLCKYYNSSQTKSAWPHYSLKEQEKPQLVTLYKWPGVWQNVQAYVPIKDSDQLRICTVWSESLMAALRVTKGLTFLQVEN